MQYIMLKTWHNVIPFQSWYTSISPCFRQGRGHRTIPLFKHIGSLGSYQTLNMSTWEKWKKNITQEVHVLWGHCSPIRELLWPSAIKRSYVHETRPIAIWSLRVSWCSVQCLNGERFHSVKLNFPWKCFPFIWTMFEYNFSCPMESVILFLDD